MSQSAVVDGQPRNNEWLRRHGLRRCFTCKEVHPSAEYTDGSRRCERCRIGTRTCRVCSIEKPKTEYGYRRTTCNDCRAIPGDRHPRACLRCWEVKSVVAFPLGDGKLKGVCNDCRDAEATERALREQERAAKCNQWTDPITGVLTRRCTKCDHVGPCGEDFYVGLRNEDGSIKRYDSFCKVCRRVQVNDWTERTRADPVKGAQLRARMAAWSAKWREENPETNKASQRAYREARAADPVLHAEDLENRRIAYRLKREREGYEPRAGSATAIMGPDSMPSLPAQPLGELVYEMAQQDDGGLNAVCLSLRVDPRNAFAWSHGERESVQFDVADRVLTLSGRTWWEVWPQEEWPDVHDVISGAGERESVLAAA